MKFLIFHICFIPFFFSIELINWLCILLDELFYPSYKKVIIESPVYISGMPRTGTTFMYNLLYHNSTELTSMKLWEIAFAPSVIQKKLFVFIHKIDKKIKLPLTKFFKRTERKIFRGLDSSHPLRLSNIEEDEYLLMHNFSSSLLLFFFPYFKNKLLSIIINGTSTKKRARNLHFYKNCVKKHLFVFGKNKTYLAKSPTHLLRYDLLKDNFKDLRMICMIRIPAQTIPSTIKLFCNFNNCFHSQLKTKLIIETTLNMADHSYHKLIAEVDNTDNQAFFVVDYENLIRNPEQVLLKIADTLNFASVRKNTGKIKSFLSDTSGFKSHQEYSLEAFNLNIVDIKERYKPIYDQFFSEVPIN